MKRKIAIFLISIMTMCTLCSCGQEKVEAQPDVLQIRNICELATLECYYHNVAKSTKTKGTGITAIGEKDREFWTEYTGVVKIGIDMSEVAMEVKDTEVKITLPAARLLESHVDESTYNAESCIFSEDGFINKNKITAEDQRAAITNAQLEMENQVINDKSLLLNAQNRAQTLIENYINQLGEMVGVEYTITWIYTDK